MNFENMTPDEISLNTFPEDRINYFRELYLKYGEDLKKYLARQREFFNCYPSNLDDIEAELLYLMIRDEKPETVLEVSSAHGYSTTWILSALKDNNFGTLYSCDTINAEENILLELRNRLNFKCNQVENILDTLPKEVDFLLIDSDHRLPFAARLFDTLVPKVRIGCKVLVHDVFAFAHPAHGEAIHVFKYLNDNNIKCYTPSVCWFNNLSYIMKIRLEVGIDHTINRTCNRNSMLIFEKPMVV